MESLGYDPSDTTTDTSTPTGIGNVTAGAVLAFRHTDGPISSAISIPVPIPSTRRSTTQSTTALITWTTRITGNP